MRRLGIQMLLVVWSVQLTGQVSISGGFTQDTVVIGDEANFVLSLELEGGVEVLAIPSFFTDSVYSALQSVRAHQDTTEDIKPVIADFELISTGGFNDVNGDGLYTSDEMEWKVTQIGSRTLLENTFTILPWDPGETYVLYPPVVYNYNGEQDQAVRQEQMSVFVAPPGDIPAVQDSIDLAPIKNIKEEKANISDYLIFFILIGIALLTGLVYWLFTKYRNRDAAIGIEEEEEVVIIPPHILALEKLSELKRQELWQKGDIKQYQSELTYIIREYLEGRYGVHALESTTNEVVDALKKQLMQNDDVISVKRILQVADLVKFAKAKPDENIHETFMHEAENFVGRTKVEEESTDD